MNPTLGIRLPVPSKMNLLQCRICFSILYFLYIYIFLTDIRLIYYVVCYHLTSSGNSVCIITEKYYEGFSSLKSFVLFYECVSQEVSTATHIVMAELAPMIRKRSRPQPRIRKVSLEKEEVAEPTPENEAEAGLPYVLQPSSVPNSKYL